MSEKIKDYFTSREAAELLDVAVSTIQNWSNDGLLRVWTTGGGHRRIARSSVEEMLNRKNAISSEKKTEDQLTIVVVEDDPGQLRMYENLFIGWRLNAHVVTASDGYGGLVKIGRHLPDIIISDLKMPDMDGFEMVRALKEIPELENSLIIVVTGLDRIEIEKRGGLPEDVHIFIKPIPFDTLKELIHDKAQLKMQSSTKQNIG